ncbi:MAG: putative quinol monooxygenase [Acetobacteraceae bacterium]|nr:putative quinol monooxygenase [Acetobacteraceae bacterium]
MKPLTVVAKLTAKPGKEDELLPMLQALLAPTHAEPGCINYDLHRSHEQPGTFMFIESWASRELLEAHMKSPHLVEFSDKQGALTESWDLFVGELV